MEGSSGLSVLASLCRKAGRRGLHAAGLPQPARSVTASESRWGTGVYVCRPCFWTVPQTVGGKDYNLRIFIPLPQYLAYLDNWYPTVTGDALSCKDIAENWV